MIRYKFKHQPYAHQLTALEKCWDQDEYALFCEMGTGKSKILIDNFSILYDQGKIDAVLVVAPKGVYKNWQKKEIPQHLPDHIVADIIVWSPNHTKKQLEHLDLAFKDDDNLKILVMNVEAFSTDKGFKFALKFLSRKKVFMAIDESTTIKNRGAKRTKNIVKAGEHARYRRIATGSPITKTPMDLFSQCEYLSPDLLGFGSFFTFQARYCKIWRRSVGSHSFNQVVGYQNLDELTDKLDRFSYRILKKDCLDLPEKIYIKRVVELTPEQRRVYEQLKAIALAVLQEGVVTAANALTQILRLQQVCSGFVKTDDGHIQVLPSEKLNELMEVLEEVDGKVIIWANYTHDIEAITKKLADTYGPETVRSYYGDTKADDRQQIVTDFQDPKNPLRFFVGQPRTGGYGLTLTEAKTVIYYSNSYDLEVRLQSEDRAHRIGQKNNVTYIDIVTEGTVDEKILHALRSKIDIASTVLKEGYKDWII
jgi:SNF2 family DNA or RNA helicase